MVLRGANPKPIAPHRGANPKPSARLGSAIGGPYYGPNRDRVARVVRVTRTGRIVRAAARRLAPRRQPEANQPRAAGPLPEQTRSGPGHGPRPEANPRPQVPEN